MPRHRRMTSEEAVTAKDGSTVVLPRGTPIGLVRRMRDGRYSFKAGGGRGKYTHTAASAPERLPRGARKFPEGTWHAKQREVDPRYGDRHTNGSEWNSGSYVMILKDLVSRDVVAAVIRPIPKPPTQEGCGMYMPNGKPCPKPREKVSKFCKVHNRA